MKIYIIGHKSPDLDAVSSTVTYAEFLRKSKRYEGAQIVPARAGEPNQETRYIFKKFATEIPVLIDDLELDTTDAFVLIDHNEEAQRSEKVISSQIIEIVDHHKLNLSFTSPVRIDVKPYGSTNTIVYELFDMFGLKPSEKISGLILSSILSDTVGLKSTTTTGMDSTIATKLAKELGLDIEKLTLEIFKAKSDLSGLSAKDIVMKDFKVFDFNGVRVFIGEVETTEPEDVLKKKSRLIQALSDVKAEQNAGHAYLFITDILKIKSLALYVTQEEKEVLEKAFTTEGIDGIADVGPRISRKKDFVPAIEKVLSTP